MGIIAAPRLRVDPTITDSITHPNEGRDMASYGDLLFSLSTAGNFVVTDKSDPENLVILGQLASGETGFADLNGAHGVTVTSDGTVAFVAAQAADRLVAIDITDPSDPTFISSVQDTTALNGATDVLLSDDDGYAYVSALLNDGLAVVDVSNPASMSVVGSISSATDLIGPHGIARSGDRVYIGNSGAGADNGLTCVDVSNPASPSILGSGEEPTHLAQPFAVDIEGDYAFTVNSGPANRMDVWEIADPTTHVPHNTPIWRAQAGRGALDPYDELTIARPLNIVCRDGFAFIPCQIDLGIFCYVDIQDPLDPVYLGRVEQPVPGSPSDSGSGELYHNYGCVVPGDGYAYVTAHGDGHITSLRINHNYGEYADSGNGPRIA